MGIMEDLVANILETNFESLDQNSIHKAKVRMLDSVGVLIAGADAAGCDMMLNLLKRWGGTPESTVLVHGFKTVAHNAAMMNSLMMRSFDFEPVEAEGPDGKTAPAHISGSTVPAAIAVAESQGLSGKDFITALILGDDLASRMGMATGFSFGAGWDNTGTINGFGTTAIAGKLYKLDQKQMQNAFGIVIHQLGGSMAGVVDKSLSFKLPIALAAKNGIFSAELAKQGYTGVKDAFIGKQGYFDLFCSAPDPESLTKDLGNKFYADCHIKPWPCCRATHPSIDAVFQILNSNGVASEDIAEIIIKLAPGAEFITQPYILGENPQVDAAFNVRYLVANAILRKAIKPEHFSDTALKDPQIYELINKMQIIFSLPTGQILNSEVSIKMKNGKVLSAFTSVPKGDMNNNPLTNDEIKEKFRSNVNYSNTITNSKAEKALEMIENIENVDNIRELTALLVK